MKAIDTHKNDCTLQSNKNEKEMEQNKYKWTVCKAWEITDLIC